MKHVRIIITNKTSIKLLIVFLIPLFFAHVIYGEKLNPDLNTYTQKVGNGYKIAGICFSSVGGACVLTSIPLYVSAIHKAESNNMIGSNIHGVFGDCFFIGGLVLGGISIPFYVKHKKLNKGTKVSFDLGPNTIHMLYNF
jgi:hypothetical protein